MYNAADGPVPQFTGPYERWVFGEGLGKPFAFPAIQEGGSQYFTALMDGDGPLPDPETEIVLDAGDGQPERVVSVRLPPLWRPGTENLSVRPFAFADLDHSSVDQSPDILGAVLQYLHGMGGTDTDARFRINFPINPATWTIGYDPEAASMDWKKARRPKAIIGIIDDGIPFAHRCFLDGDDKTRMQYCWLQSARAVDGAQVPFGRELANDQIDGYRGDYGHDEDLLYREAGAVDASLRELGSYLNRHTTHGAHVGGLAAGAGRGIHATPEDDDIQIIAVQLPNTIAWDTSGFGKEMYMLSAIHYIMERAKRIAAAYDPDGPEIPLVINFSYGWSGGRHDGQSEMEAAMQELVSLRTSKNYDKCAPTHIVMPSGNTFSNKMNARIEDRHFSGGARALNWHVQPDDKTSSYVEFWFPEGLDPAEDYRLEVEPPTGAFDAPAVLALKADPASDGGDRAEYLDFKLGGHIIGQLSVDKNRGSRWRAMVAITPTDGTSRKAPVGKWKLTLRRDGKATLGEDQSINVWVQRDDDPAELRTGGRQSYLTDPDQGAADKPALLQFKSDPGMISGFGSLNGVASAPSTIRIGGYVGLSGTPAPYSSAGQLRKTDGAPELVPEAVNLAAPSDRGASLPGIVGPAARSGSRSILIGTSVAAPLAARQIARNLADGLSYDAGFDPLATEDDPVRRAHIKARLGHGLLPFAER